MLRRPSVAVTNASAALRTRIRSRERLKTTNLAYGRAGGRADSGAVPSARLLALSQALASHS